MAERRNLCEAQYLKRTPFHELDPFGERAKQQSTNTHWSDDSRSRSDGENPASSLTEILDEPPSCIEFCSKDYTILVVGTYVLSTSSTGDNEAPEQQRRGSLFLLRLDSNTEAELFSEALRLDCAVLDLHYCTSSAGGNLFAISTSNGKVGLFVWLTSPLRLKLLSWINISGGSDALVTSFVWINGLRSNDRNSALLAFAVTLTDGSARLYAGDNLEILSAGKVQLIYSFRRHSQEAWYIAFSESRRLLFSGGDDMALSAYSLESLVPFESTGELAPLWTDHKSHYAGVTAILPLEQIQTPFNTLYFLTGSYDERIRVYKLDQATKRHVVAEQGLGGGVWRLKQISDSWHEYPSSDFEGQRDCTLVLASCMHAGAKVLQVVRTCEGHCIHDSCIWTIDVVAKFEEHDSMNYASDVRMLNGKPQIVSTSFYDKRLCFWSLGKWSLGQNALRAADLIRARMRDDVSD